MFLFNILCSMLSVGKHVCRSQKNIFPILVVTFTLNMGKGGGGGGGGLNQMMFLFLVLFSFLPLFRPPGRSHFIL